ncbi:MAG TPA: serine hydrolase [Thermoanaerobaculia bacterium]
MRVAAALLLAATVAAPGPAPKEAALFARLRERVETVSKNLDGVIGVSIRDLGSGATIEMLAGEPFPQASSIKLAILYELYRQAEERTIDLGERVTPAGPRAAGSGVLQHLGPDVTLTWRDLAILMMGWSDNEATNLIIDRVGIDSVNRRLDALGLARTRLRRRMMDTAAARRGEENVSTPAEMRRLVETLYAGTGLSPERAKDMLDVAATPKSSSFRGPVPGSVRVIDKPGELEGVRCVTAIVDLPGRPDSAAIMTTYLRRDADGEAAIREISAALYETFDRLARSTELGRRAP